LFCVGLESESFRQTFWRKFPESFRKFSESFQVTFFWKDSILNFILLFSVIMPQIRSWSHQYFTKDKETGKVKCNFCPKEYAENATRQEKHLLVSL